MTATPQATSPAGTLLRLMNCGFDQTLPEHPVLYTATDDNDVLNLSSTVFDVRRHRPLVVVTRRTNGRTTIDAHQLAARLWNTADVVELATHHAAQGLCALLPSWLGVYGGHARAYLPGTDIADDRRAHPLINRADTPADEFLGKIVSIVERHTRNHRRADPAVALIKERTAHERTREEVTRLREELSRARDAEPQNGTEQRFADPVVQFEHDLWLAWLDTVPEPDRDTWAMRPYTLGPDFLDSIDQLENVARDRIMRACVDVITGRYPYLSGREAKRFRGIAHGKSSGTPNLVRERDGASAWRLAIGMGGIAPRLMWWETDDGEPELSRVTEHNDMRIT